MKKISCMKRLMVAGLLLLGMVGEVFGQTDVPDGYVDMGVRADNGDNLYWAGHDLVLYKDGSVKYAQGAQQGSNIRWKYVADLLGGYYGVEHKRFPMGDFAGDGQYDFVRHKLGSPYRLPTYAEILRLLENCTYRVDTFGSQLPEYDKHGAPTWLYGQWMWQTQVSGPRGTFGGWISIQFDEAVVNVSSSDEGVLYEGVYAYNKEKQTVSFGDYKLKVKVPGRQLLMEGGMDAVYEKVSSNAMAGQQSFLTLTSKVNGRRLRIALPKPLSSAGNERGMIVYRNEQTVYYWSGTVVSEDGHTGLVTMRVSGGSPDMYGDEQYWEHSFRMRPVWVAGGTGASRAEVARRAGLRMEQMKQEQAACKQECAEAIDSVSIFQGNVMNKVNKERLNHYTLQQYREAADKLRLYKTTGRNVYGGYGFNVGRERQNMAEAWEEIESHYIYLLAVYDNSLRDAAHLPDSVSLVGKLADRQQAWRQEAQDSLDTYGEERAKMAEAYAGIDAFYDRQLKIVKSSPLRERAERNLRVKREKLQAEYDELAALSDDKAKKRDKGGKDKDKDEDRSKKRKARWKELFNDIQVEMRSGNRRTR